MKLVPFCADLGAQDPGVLSVMSDRSDTRTDGMGTEATVIDRIHPLGARQYLADPTRDWVSGPVSS